MPDAAAEDEAGIKAGVGAGGGEVESEFDIEDAVVVVGERAKVQHVIGEVSLRGGHGGESLIDLKLAFAVELEIQLAETGAGDNRIGQADH